MHSVTSKDGTSISYVKQGTGPAIVLVDGALCDTRSGITPRLLPVLSQHFTVYAYDRRGRGNSGNAPVYSIQNEIDDLSAIMREAGGAPFVCGFSSGAALAFYAAAAGLKPAKLILYEAPFTVVTDDDPKPPHDAVAVLEDMVTRKKNKQAVDYFMKDLIGMPGIVVTLMNLIMRKNMKASWAIAHTLPYDIRIMDQTKFRTPTDAARNISVPTLVMYGDKTPKKLANGSTALAAAIPGSTLVALPKTSHMDNPVTLTRELVSRLL